jgi:hypothetical protein
LNIAFHTLAALAIGQSAACRLQVAQRRWQRIAIGVVTFLLGVMSHGVLDGLPHEYPFRWPAETVLITVLLVTWMVIIQPRYRGLLLIAVAGALLPDVIDHVPRDLNRHLGTHLPELPKLFPWHHRGGSGSLSGTVPPDAHVASIANHIIVVSCSVLMLVLSRRALRRSTEAQNWVSRTD